MNKFAKGSVAAGAGLVLLLGGAGTLAYWNDTAELTGGTINTGKLELDADQDMLTESIESQSDLWVPGDERAFATSLTLTADGTNIQGTIALEESSIIGDTPGADEFEIQTSFDLDHVEITGDGELESDGEGGLIFTGSGVYEIPVTVTVELPYGDTATNDSSDIDVDVSGMSFTAEQSPVIAPAG
ncbi:alternate-type signal peptide domain-containing protein [Brachybacterium avium]|nr:alternate-type signal peptide domain-containing protein [Brachybacterium avium]